MKEGKVESILLEKIDDRLQQFGLSRKDADPGFDLVRTGFVNSLEFVELIADIEKELGLVIDYEKALESDKFSSVGGIVEVFESYLNE